MPVSMQGCTTLIVSGDEPVARLMQVCLESSQMRVLRAASVAEAKSALRAETQPPDLCIVDEETVGVEITFELLQVTPDTPVFRLSPKEPPLLATPAAHRCRWLSKPFSPTEFVMVVRMAVTDKCAAASPAEVQSTYQSLALDLACGGGFTTFRAAERLGPQVLVVGVDNQAAPPVDAQRRQEVIGCPNAAFVAADVRCLPFRDGTFEWVLDEEGLTVLGMSEADVDLARAESERVLRGNVSRLQSPSPAQETR